MDPEMKNDIGVPIADPVVNVTDQTALSRFMNDRVTAYIPKGFLGEVSPSRGGVDILVPFSAEFVAGVIEGAEKLSIYNQVESFRFGGTYIDPAVHGYANPGYELTRSVLGGFLDEDSLRNYVKIVSSDWAASRELRRAMEGFFESIYTSIYKTMNSSRCFPEPIRCAVRFVAEQASHVYIRQVWAEPAIYMVAYDLESSGITRLEAVLTDNNLIDVPAYRMKYAESPEQGTYFTDAQAAAATSSLVETCPAVRDVVDVQTVSEAVEFYKGAIGMKEKIENVDEYIIDDIDCVDEDFPVTEAAEDEEDCGCEDYPECGCADAPVDESAEENTTPVVTEISDDSNVAAVVNEEDDVDPDDDDDDDDDDDEEEDEGDDDEGDEEEEDEEPVVESPVVEPVVESIDDEDEDDLDLEDEGSEAAVDDFDVYDDEDDDDDEDDIADGISDEELDAALDNVGDLEDEDEEY